MASDGKTNLEKVERVSITKAAEYLLEECRMVLPGIQAIFGFQLVAVFDSGFFEYLSRSRQVLHLVALGLVGVAVAIIMTPAAYHRQHSLHEVTEAFIRISGRLLLLSMLPLAVGLCLDFYIIATLILRGGGAAFFASVLFGVFVLLWFVFPRSRRLQGLVGNQSGNGSRR